MANTNSRNTMDEVDSAYQVLKAAGHPIYYRDLIDQAIALKSGATRASAYMIADVHTRINLDSRFVHTGKSMWGLNEWSPQRVNSHEADETVAAPQDNQRREKLFAAIQQDFDSEDTSGLADPEPVLEGEEDLDEEVEDNEA
jgi:DNA-directed RNA polymerase subunit delta